MILKAEVPGTCRIRMPVSMGWMVKQLSSVLSVQLHAPVQAAFMTFGKRLEEWIVTCGQHSCVQEDQ